MNGRIKAEEFDEITIFEAEDSKRKERGGGVKCLFSGDIREYEKFTKVMLHIEGSQSPLSTVTVPPPNPPLHRLLTKNDWASISAAEAQDRPWFGNVIYICPDRFPANTVNSGYCNRFLCSRISLQLCRYLVRTAP